MPSPLLPIVFQAPGRADNGTVGRVESKLLELGEVQGLVYRNGGEVSEPFDALIAALTTS